MSRIRSVLTVAILLGVAASARAQSCAPHWEPGTAPGPNYFVFAAADWDPDGGGPRGTELVLAGGFSIPGQNDVYGLATWDGTSYRGFAGGPGLVRAVAVLPNGDLVAAGGFPPINGVPGTSNIARWDRALGTWNSIGGGIEGSDVEGLAVLADGRLVAGGQFYRAGGMPIRSLAIWDGVSWAAIPGLDWYPPYSTGDVRVSTIAARPNGDLIVAGFFGLAGPHFVDHIARWNPQTGWSPMAGGMIIQPGNGTQCYGVSDMALMPSTSGDQLVANFNYTQPPTGLLILSSVYAWNGSTWRSLGAPYGGQFFGSAYAISPINDTEVAIGGTLAFSAAAEAGRIARWNGAGWSWMGEVNSAAFVLHRRPSGELIAGGAFTTASGVPAPDWARWTTDGAIPVITQQPVSGSTCRSGEIRFSVATVAGFAQAYRWQAEDPDAPGVWFDIIDGTTARPSPTRPLFDAYYSATAELRIARSYPALSTIQLRAVVTSACGSVVSDAATLTICIADTDNGGGGGVCDGGTGIEDLLYYLGQYDAGSPRADCDDGTATGIPDGGVGIEDLLYYLGRYDAGC
jgi:hypothetical protein